MQTPDYSDTAAIQKAIYDTLHDIERRIEATAMAKQVKEYSSEQRKNLLARHMLKPLKDGESVAAAETMARASIEYEKDFALLCDQHRKAEQHTLQTDALFSKLDALRSLLSMAKETARLM